MVPKQALALLRSDNGKSDAVHRLDRDAKAEIACEDNLKFMRRLPDESMSLIITSPPYMMCCHTIRAQMAFGTN